MLSRLFSLMFEDLLQKSEHYDSDHSVTICYVYTIYYTFKTCFSAL